MKNFSLWYLALEKSAINLFYGSISRFSSSPTSERIFSFSPELFLFD
jgi:hypothetical protein